MALRSSFRVIRLGSTSKLSTVSFRGKPAARYRWNHSHSAWIRTPMPPRFVLENTPEFPPVIRPTPRQVDESTRSSPKVVHS